MLEMKTKKEEIIKTSIVRKNLNMKIIKCTDKSKTERFENRLLEFVKGKKGQKGIIYCSTRKRVRNICYSLRDNGINAVWYHGDEDYWDENHKKFKEEYRHFKKDKENNFKLFIDGDVKVMVATTAFGMGIDISDINYIVHYQMPLSIESYYQAVGRAGRKLPEAESIFYFNENEDYATCKKILNNKNNDVYLDTSNKKHKLDLLAKFVEFAKTNECLQQYILNYFGEEKGEKCGRCSNCNKVNTIMLDESLIAQLLIEDKQKDLLEKEKNKGIIVKKPSWTFIPADKTIDTEKVPSVINRPFFYKSHIQTQSIDAKEGNKLTITGIVREIVNKVNLNKIFEIKEDSMIGLNQLKVFKNDIYQQITIEQINEDNNKNSYTTLIIDDFLRNQKIKKGDKVKIKLLGRKIINITKWDCINIQKIDK